MLKAVQHLSLLVLCTTVLTPCGVSQSVDTRPASVRRIGNLDILKQLARRMEPQMHGQPERLRQYVDFFARELGNDHRLFAFDVKAVATPDGNVQLQGLVEFPETRHALVAYLDILGFAVDDQLETCPADSLGNRYLGLLKDSHSLSYDQPVEPRTVVTDCLLGEPLYLLREDHGHVLVHSGEGYVGYVDSNDIHRLDGAEFDRYTAGPMVRVISDHRTSTGQMIPKGARLKWVGSDDASVTCELPTGDSVSLPSESCRRIDPPVEQIDRIVESAEQLQGTRYLWGGKSSAGIDCSGLVQVGFATAGLHLPRDSNQQVLLGQLTATRWHRSGMKRGDTLYFIADNGKIRHTALYLGNDRFLHAVSPVVRINSFNPEHPDYDEVRAASFAFAKRLLE